ncbi:50S ribosomal protein L29 [Blattabacterium cuenoti]|uniref:50S ribosomal protein L29 n=1 Tax=Blattabacterium cuenoti TaxID=1653831 RepID=UPI00163BBFA8|nr:50S ribosomal protein L29 [Blattabacterium cuenoti]
MNDLKKNKLKIQDCSIIDLNKYIENSEKKYKNIKFSHSINRIKNHEKIKVLRRFIARLKTELIKKLKNEKKK